MYLSACLMSGSFSPNVFGEGGSSSATSVLRAALAVFATGPSDSGFAALSSSSVFFDAALGEAALAVSSALSSESALSDLAVFVFAVLASPELASAGFATDALLSITEESSSLSESADAEALLSAACELSLAAA